MAGPGVTAVDISRLLTGLRLARPSGIERMELGYAALLGAEGGGVALTPLGPRAVTAATRRRIVAAARTHWHEGPGALAPAAVADEVAAVTTFVETGRRPAPHAVRRPSLPLSLIPGLLGAALRTPQAAVPRGAAYLHASFFRLERPPYFDWLERRRDVRAVFMLYDLLPIQQPQYFREGEAALHARRIATAARHARLIVVPAATIADDLKAHLRRAGLTQPPIEVLGLPVEDVFHRAPPAEAERGRPFFLCCGTIEPRKNHRLLLDAWRLLAAERGAEAPRLVIAGRRGWRNEDVFAELDDPGALGRLVLEAPDLSSAALALLMRRARAVLSPSFAEGYGLPVAEALASGVPVLAADTPIYRELWGGQATLLAPDDTAGWAAAIAARCRQPETTAQLNAKPAHAMTWAQHIDGIEGLLAAA
ncbi:D-inositol-3-phosphate glycosyltransferase [Alphaproteobacteria bacterium SO-S41]|nr:D-inositol-3-phosphate glycosyltransferase [Alphaproteobacteria bacterium SO-S41]